MPWPKGKPRSEDTKHRISVANIGRVGPNKGRIVPEEVRRKISISVSMAKTGTKRPPFSEEWKRNISLANRGKVHLNQRGKKPWNFGLTKDTDPRVTWGDKISMARKGKPHPWHRGENHPFWKGGTSASHQRTWGTVEYSNWRTSVFERDNYTCVECGVHNKNGLGKTVQLNADHIKPFAFYPDLRYEVSNGRTLCLSCHRKTDTWGRRAVVKQLATQK